MLFGPQFDDDAGDRIEPSPLRKKKTRSTRAPPPPKPNASTAIAASALPTRLTRRTPAIPSKQPANDTNGEAFYSNSAGSSSSGSFSNYYTSNANMNTTPIKSRRRDPSNAPSSTAARGKFQDPNATKDVTCMYATVWKSLHFRKKTIPLASSTSVNPICVTGVDGFLASWIVCELLSRGYRVRGTVQSRTDDISGILALPNARNFTVVETSLLTPESCDLAVQGCDFVIHTGTPSSCSVRDPLSEQMEPGVHSIGSRMHCIIPMMTNFIQACARARVKRVVLTSSVAAMADSVTPSAIINENCWNITSTLERNPHFLSLKLAEEAAWQLVDQLPRDFRIDLVTINPGTLFGPSLSKSKLAPGNQVIFDLITGQYSALVDLNWSLVDVRDCATAHVDALENLEARGRYICVNRTVWMKDIVDYLARHGFSGRDLPWRVGLPNWVARLPAYAAQLGQVGASLSAYDPNSARPSPYLNEKVTDHFNLHFRDAKQTVIESANDLLKWGYIKPWAEDHEALDCNICHEIFTFYRRKHHCRECGVIICAECSMSRAVVEGAEGKVRLCDKCVKNSIPGLLDLLSEDDELSQKHAAMAIEALMENESNHDYVTRYDGIARLLRVLHSFDDATASHAAGALVALSMNVSSALQMVLEGAVLQMLEVDETTNAWGICLQALRNIWKQINRNDFRKMLHAVARVSTRTNKGDLQGNILLTFVHMMDPNEVPKLLSEGLLSVLFQMLQSAEIFPRCAAAHAVKHLVPMTYAPDVTIQVPMYLVDDHEELLANSSLSDLQFLVKGHIAPINAHKVVLFFRNSYFKNMVSFGTATSQKGMIEIDNCSYEVFSLLLRFLYTGKVAITPDIAQELLRASSFYHVFELQKRAEEFLAGEIRVENVVDLLSLAEECRADDLKRNCVPFLMRNIHEVVGLPSYGDHRIRASEEVLKALAGMLGPEWEESYNKMLQDIADADGTKKKKQASQLTSRSFRSMGSLPMFDDRKAHHDSFTPTKFLSPTATYSMEGRSSGFTSTTTTTNYSPPHQYRPSQDQVAPPIDLPFMKAFGNDVMVFPRGRQPSEDLSEVLSEAKARSSPSMRNLPAEERTLHSSTRGSIPHIAETKNEVDSISLELIPVALAMAQRPHNSHGVVVRVGNAANGVVYSVRLASTDLIVEELSEQVAACSDVPMGDQILLGGPPFTRLDPKRPLSYYGIPARDKHVYLYDRRMLSQDNPVPPRLALEPVDFEFPTTPVASSENSRILSESMSPLIRALPDYEAHFLLQLNQSEALERSSAANVAACERCVAELHVQAGAIEAAIANLDTFRDTMNKHFLPFWSEFEAAAATHETLLANFEAYVAALQTVTLHPALQTDDRKTLYDCIPVDHEREWAVQCEQSHIAMRTQVGRLKQVHDEIYEEVGVLVRSQDQVSVAYADTTHDLERMKQFVTAHEEITAKLATNVEFVSNKIAASANAEVNTMFASTAMLDVCRDIERLYQEQYESIPSAQKLAEEIKATMGKFSSVKAAFFARVHGNLRKISVSQSKIRDFENSLAMLKEALAAQKKQFSELDHVRMLPEAYAACLKEIARRVRYGRRFSDRIQSMAEELAQMRDDEVHHREVFLQSYGHHMPRVLVPGLAEKPSHCEFRMRPFDQNLPQIEDGDDDEVGGSAASATESKEDDEFFESRASDGVSPHNGSHAAEVDGLQKRCEELEAKVAQLTLELQQSKKGSSYFSDGSLAQSDISKTSLREGDSSCEFPLVLALAATAGAMTSSSEADRSNLLERELQSLKVKAETESQDRDKNARIAKLENDNQQYLLNATALEEEIQERTRRETQLLDNQAKLQQSVRELQLSTETQRSALGKVLQLLDLQPPRDRDLADPAQFVATHLDRVEARIRELTAVVDSEQNLRRELAQKKDEINLLESQHIDVNDSFKISFRSFNYDDVALFLPTSVPGSDAQRVYLAFHHGCPHRFLSEESISSFMIGGRKYPDYVVGRIVLIDEQIASEAHNPYGLHLGTTFYILTVASLQDT